MAHAGGRKNLRECDCKARLATVDSPCSVLPHLLPDGNIEETFFVDKTHYWVERWSPTDFRRLLLDCHSDAGIARAESKFRCLYCDLTVQKHRLNVHRFHGCAGGPRDPDTHHYLRLQAYPTLPWKDTGSAVKLLEHDGDIAHMFRTMALQSKDRAREKTFSPKRKNKASVRVPLPVSSRGSLQVPSSSLRSLGPRPPPPHKRADSKRTPGQGKKRPRPQDTGSASDGECPPGRKKSAPLGLAPNVVDVTDTSDSDSASVCPYKRALAGHPAQGEIDQQEVLGDGTHRVVAKRGTTSQANAGHPPQDHDDQGSPLEVYSPTDFDFENPKEIAHMRMRYAEDKGKQPMPNVVPAEPPKSGLGAFSDSSVDGSRLQRLATERDEKKKIFLEEAIAAFPLVDLPTQPQPHRYVTGLARLVEHGLLGDKDYKSFVIGDFMKELFCFVATEGSRAAFDRALGAYVIQRYERGGLKEFADDDIQVQDCVKQGKKVPLDQKYWSEVLTDTFMYLDTERQWDDYHRASKLIMSENAQHRREYVERKLKEFDFSKALEREAAIWDWNPLFHYCALNPVIRARLGPLPWSHSDDEARMFLRNLCQSRTKRVEVPDEARLCKLFVHCNGRRDRSASPTPMYFVHYWS